MSNAENFSLHSHLLRQMAFSHATYGPGERQDGLIDHLRKELREMKEAGGDPTEWVDIVILGLDGLTRSLCYDDEVLDEHGHPKRTNPLIVADDAINLLVEKQGINEGRVWPNWRTATKGKAIEHDRSKEGLA